MTTLAVSGRDLVVESLGASGSCAPKRPFATLVPAFDMDERQRVAAMAGRLVDLGCVEFCCVGPEAEKLHDSLDEIVEARGDLTVVTTWHTDHFEACEYFLYAAAGNPPTLLALIASHADLVDGLKRAIDEGS